MFEKVIRVVLVVLITASIATVAIEARRASHTAPTVPSRPLSPEEKRFAEEAALNRLTRTQFLQVCEDALLEGGRDAYCQLMSDNDQHLVISGPGIDRVFAYQFVHYRGLVAKMQERGFTAVTFWNRDRDYMQTFDLDSLSQ